MPLITVKYNVNDVHAAVDYILNNNPYTNENNWKYEDVYNSIMNAIHRISNSYKTKNPFSYLATMGHVINVNDVSYNGNHNLIVYVEIHAEFFTDDNHYGSIDNCVGDDVFYYHVNNIK